MEEQVHRFQEQNQKPPPLITFTGARSFLKERLLAFFCIPCRLQTFFQILPSWICVFAPAGHDGFRRLLALYFPPLISLRGLI